MGVHRRCRCRGALLERPNGIGAEIMSHQHFNVTSRPAPYSAAYFNLTRPPCAERPGSPAAAAGGASNLISSDAAAVTCNSLFGLSDR